jgi:putative phosphoribosyl transferase
MIYSDRRHAGRRLADELADYRGRADALVLALPRGGVPVAFEVARALDLPLDVLVVRKIGVPGQPEYALGALASGGLCVLNHELVEALAIRPEALREVIDAERSELIRRERRYRGDRPRPPLAGRCVLLVDDGLATGSSMKVALQAARRAEAAEVVVAVPVGSRDAVRMFNEEADAVFCPATPEPFRGVGLWYRDFTQTDDAEVDGLLRRTRRPAAPAPLAAAQGQSDGRPG